MRDWIFKLLLTVILVAITGLIFDMIGVREYMVNSDWIKEPIYLVQVSR